jgi:choline transport protein
VLNYEWCVKVFQCMVQAAIECLLLARYVFERWHGTLLILAMLLCAFTSNTLLAHQLPLLEYIVLFIHICGFFCILIPLWVLAEKAPSRQVWTTFYDPGWGNQGLSCLIGIVASVAPLLGADAAGGSIQFFVLVRKS